jgi:hypothetical protein
MLCLLLWVPHQAIPAFIAVGLLRRMQTAEALGPTALAISTLALWSPYALIGTVLLFVPHMLSQTALRLAFRRPEWTVGAASVVACAFAALMAWNLSHEMPAGGLCLDCAPARLARPGPYLLLLAVELAIPLLVLRRRLFEDAASVAAIATLGVLPWIGGAVPDAVMRISMPALIYLFVRSAHHVAQRPPGRMAASAALVLALGGPTVWGEASFHVEAGARHAALPARDPLRAPSYTVWAQRTTYTAHEFFEICGWLVPTVLRQDTATQLAKHCVQSNALTQQGAGPCHHARPCHPRPPFRPAPYSALPWPQHSLRCWPSIKPRPRRSITSCWLWPAGDSPSFGGRKPPPPGAPD